MAKLSGFCLSALLIVLCLRINVYCYPDAFRIAAPTTVENAPTDAENQTSLESVPNPKDEAVSDTSQRAPNATPDKAQDSTNGKNNDEKNGETSAPDSAELTEEGTIVAQAFPSNPPQDSRSLNVEVGTDVRPEPGAALEPASMTREIPDKTSASSKTEGGVPARLEKEPETSATGGATSHRKTNSSEEKTSKTTKTSASTKPQGGKYVSIPSVKTDALAPSASDGDCRVVGATRAVRTRIVPNAQP